MTAPHGRFLVFGATSQIGRALSGQPGVTVLSRQQADLTDARRCVQRMEEHAPTAVINAACHGDIDGAETSRGRAFLVNGRAPGVLARHCASRGIPFIHMSSEFVFSGDGSAPWTPESPTAPCQAFGRSRLRGEQQVRAAAGVHAILRTSWLFSAQGRNVLRSLLRAAGARDRLAVRGDLVAQPTPAVAAAAAAVQIAKTLAERPDLSGTYHFAGDAPASLADVAREAVAAAGLDVKITSQHHASAVPWLAPRPLNGRLDTRRTSEVFGIAAPDWRADLARTARRFQDARRAAGKAA
ncbi:MAG: sugar nucleotide-binding protein [Pseudomonadota bacterium]